MNESNVYAHACKIVLYYHLFINYRLNYFYIIILKVNNYI